MNKTTFRALSFSCITGVIFCFVTIGCSEGRTANIAAPAKAKTVPSRLVKSSNRLELCTWKVYAEVIEDTKTGQEYFVVYNDDNGGVSVIAIRGNDE